MDKQTVVRVGSELQGLNKRLRYSPQPFVYSLKSKQLKYPKLMLFSFILRIHPLGDNMTPVDRIGSRPLFETHEHVTSEFSMLPEDIIIQALAYLNFKDLGRMALTAQAFRNVLMNNRDDQVFTPAVAIRLAEAKKLTSNEIDGIVPQYRGDTSIA